MDQEHLDLLDYLEKSIQEFKTSIPIDDNSHEHVGKLREFRKEILPIMQYKLRRIKSTFQNHLNNPKVNQIIGSYQECLDWLESLPLHINEDYLVFLKHMNIGDYLTREQLMEHCKEDELKRTSPEKFTERATRVLYLALQEAKRFNHTELTPVHILLGLAKEGSGIGATVLKNYGLDLKCIRMSVEQFHLTTTNEFMCHVKEDSSYRHVLRQAEIEANNLNHTYVGTEHLLLALLHCVQYYMSYSYSTALQVLLEKSPLDEIRKSVLNMLGHGEKLPKVSNFEETRGYIYSMILEAFSTGEPADKTIAKITNLCNEIHEANNQSRS